MKKTLLALALMACLSAQAQVGKLTNESGGEIVFTARVCKNNGKVYEELREAYAVGSEGKRIEGCWYLAEGYMHTVWKPAFPGDTDTRRSYPVRNVRFYDAEGNRLQ